MARAAAAGVSVLSVTDHDTVAGLANARAAAGSLGLRLVSGIEISAVNQGHDVHVLAYFFDPESAALGEFLRAQREERIRRALEVGSRLKDLGAGIDMDALVARAIGTDRSVGRPAIADALIAAGHAADRDDAFARLLGGGRPAFVPRRGVGAEDVIQVVHAAGGIASLAHPGVLGEDGLIPGLAESGLDALEVWHSDHSPPQQAHYYALAARLGLARSGGSDYHGDSVHRACRIGMVALPSNELARLESLVGRG